MTTRQKLVQVEFLYTYVNIIVIPQYTSIYSLKKYFTGLIFGVEGDC